MSNTNNENKQLTTPAQAGMLLGAYLLCTYTLWMFIPQIPMLSILYLIALLGVPIIAYRLMKRFRSYIPKHLPFSSYLAWAYGTQVFLFAAIILLIPSYLYITQLLPNQLPYFEESINRLIAENPELGKSITTLYGRNPVDLIYKWLADNSAGSYVLSTFTTTVILGSIVSLVNALLLRRKPIQQN